MKVGTLFKNNDTLVRLRGVEDALLSGADRYIDNTEAQVRMTLYDSAKKEVGGPTWPISLNYEAGSNGDWSGVIPADGLGVFVDTVYRLVVDIFDVSGTFLRAQTVQPVFCKVRNPED